MLTQLTMVGREMSDSGRQCMLFRAIIIDMERREQMIAFYSIGWQTNALERKIACPLLGLDPI